MSTAVKPRLSGHCGTADQHADPRAAHERCVLDECGCFCHFAIEVLTETGVLVTDAEPETDAWFAARREGITGTDLPKILGLSKYGNALSVWLDKRDQLDDDGASEAARWGQILEDPVAEEWAERNDCLLERVGVLANVEYPWQRASLDRLVIGGTCPDRDAGGQGCGLEIKTRSAFKAADWRDGIPDDVLAQVAWGLRVTGLHHMHIAALIGGQRMTSFRVDRDPKLEQYLVDQAHPIWQAVLVGEQPPAAPDGDEVLLNLLDRLYAEREGTVELTAADVRPWLDQYAEGSDLERRAKKLKTEAKTALVEMLGAGEIATVDEAPAFTYRRPGATHAMTADAQRRLRRDDPDRWQQLVDDDYIALGNPGPRFTLTKEKSA